MKNINWWGLIPLALAYTALPLAFWYPGPAIVFELFVIGAMVENSR